jgi:uncharacterized protein (DUF697 family)
MARALQANKLRVARAPGSHWSRAVRTPGRKKRLENAVFEDFDVASGEASEEEKNRAVDRAIRTSSARAAVVVLQPVSFVDVATLTPLQKKMVENIGRIRDCGDSDAAAGILRALFGRLVAPHLAIAGVKCIPGVPVLPTLVAASVAYAMTYAIGKVSDDFFCEKPALPARELRARFRAVFRQTFEQALREVRGARSERVIGHRPQR